MDMMNNTSGMYGPPGYGFPPPPKKSRFGLIAAAMAGSLALGIGGAFIADRVSDTKSDQIASESSSSSRTLPPVSGAPRVPSGSSGSGDPSGGTTASQQEFFTLLGRAGIKAKDSAAVISQGNAACGVLGRRGSLKDAASAASADFASDDPQQREIYGLVMSVVSVQTLCPQNTPLVKSVYPTNGPAPQGRDGEFIRRLQQVGIGVGVPADAIRDAQGGGLNGQDVCSLVKGASLGGFYTAVRAISAVTFPANPAAGETSAVFFTVIAIQSYCPI